MSTAIEAMRAELTHRLIDDRTHWRVLFIGRSINGTTDIVSCLSRSLRNLGHHVLDLDLKLHGDLVHNPTGAKGGHGPIYLRPEVLRRTIDGFRPQVIVCAAGGLTFQPEDAEALKRRGIVLVGLTLSDPDVFPSVHPHASVFDVHTTNSRLALGMYRDKGVNNTVYFPFGIDRGFVTQQVEPAHELAADVICMGHASGRPERNSLMTTLSREFKVKTYGRGWELEGSVPVEGERMLQAMRMGRVQINFPLTRAGFVNIKCGVFESIGAGAVLCTGRFEEMAEFFDYGTEIIGYDSSEDLIPQLHELLADSSKMDRIRERGFRRLLDEHLYEHRWIKLFDVLRGAGAGSMPWLTTERTQQIQSILVQSLPRAKKIIVSGFYGARNLGDELILSSIRAGLEAADPAVQVWVAAENRQHVERDHGLQAHVRRNHHESLFSLRTASAVVLGGGGLWHDYTFHRAHGVLGLFNNPTISIAGFGVLPLMGRVFDVPCHVVGMGVGPLTHPDAMAMIRFLARQTESVYVRDEDSTELLRAAGVPSDKLLTAPDVVYALPLQESVVPAALSEMQSRGLKLVALNLRPWAPIDEAGLIDRVSASLKTLAQGERIGVIGVPMQAGDRMDVAVLHKVAAALGDDVPMAVLDAHLRPAELVGVLSSVQLLFAMRLHACLVAHRVGVPVVGLAYDPKLTAHFAELGRSDCCLPIDAPVQRMEDALIAAMAEQGRLDAAVRHRIQGFESSARVALGHAARAIAETPARERAYEVPGVLDAAIVPPPDAKAPPGGRATAKLPPLAKVALAAAKPPTAVFGHAVLRVDRIELPAFETGKAQAGTRELFVSLPTQKPRAGQRVRVDALLQIDAEGGVEVALRLESRYERDKNAGRIFFRCQVGEFVFEEDLALSSEPVYLRLFHPTPGALPVSLEVRADRNCFESAAWPRATQVRLRVQSVSPASELRRSSLATSRGVVSIGSAELG